MGNSAKALACKAFKEKVAKGLQSSNSFLSFLNSVDDTTWAIFMSNLQYNGTELAHADCTRLAEVLDKAQVAQVLTNFGVSDQQFTENYDQGCILFDCEDIQNAYCNPSLCHLPDA
jgi:hypothetical protein